MLRIFVIIFSTLPVLFFVSVLNEYRISSLLFLFWFLSYVFFGLWILISSLTKIFKLKENTRIYKLAALLKKRFPKIKLSSNVIFSFLNIFILFFVTVLGIYTSTRFIAWHFKNKYSQEIVELFDAMSNSDKMGTIESDVGELASEVRQLNRRMFEEKSEEFFANNPLELRYTVGTRLYYLGYLTDEPSNTGFDSIMNYRLEICNEYDNGRFCDIATYMVSDDEYYFYKDPNSPYIKFNTDETILNFDIDEYYLGDAENPVVVVNVSTDKRDFSTVIYPEDNETFINQYFLTDASYDDSYVNITEQSDSKLTLEFVENSYSKDGEPLGTRTTDILFEYDYEAELLNMDLYKGDWE